MQQISTNMPRQRRIDFPDFSKLQLDLNGFMRKLPALIGNTAANFYKDSWNREGYIDQGIARWPKRKHTNGKPRRTLVKTGRLRRSIRYRTSGTRIMIFTDVPYAEVHNEGGHVSAKQTVKAHTRRNKKNGNNIKVASHTRQVNFTMPKRQFMDIPGQRPSRLLEQRLVALTARALDQIIRKQL